MAQTRAPATVTGRRGGAVGCTSLGGDAAQVIDAIGRLAPTHRFGLTPAGKTAYITTR